ncbi:MAG: FtsQ-type POTRA domain-containing protein [Clostridiales bacterium]|nr:FtsQ-type POTRA domain-containing protein [Clostridiales bacterium]
MNEKDRFEPNNGQQSPETERVYAPTHPGLRTLNLRPFKGEEADDAIAAETAENRENDPALTETEEGNDGAGAEYEEGTDEEREETDDTEEKADLNLFDVEEERPLTVAEAKRRDRRLTEREKRRRARRRRMMRLVSTAIFFVAAAAALLLVYFVLIIDKIEVYGMERFTEEEILEASGLRAGQHMWLAQLGAAKEAIEADPYIASVEITRIYPDRLVLRVTERRERAVILGMNTHAVIDGEGYVLSLGTRASYEGLLEVYGTGAGSYHVNQKLGEESDFHSRTLVTLLRALEEEELLDTVRTLDISNPLRITMVTFDGLSVIFGQSDNAAEKLMNFRMVLPMLVQRGYHDSGTLDLSAKGSPVYSPPQSTVMLPIEPEGSMPQDTALPNGTAEPSVPEAPGASPLPEETAAPQPIALPEDGFSG